MVLQENKIFCPAKQFGINHWILHKSKREQNGLTRSILHKKKRAEWYRSLNPEEKEKLLSGRAEWYKTLDPADEDRIISQVQADKEAHRNSVQHNIDHKITAFQSKIREGSYYIFSVCNRILYYTILNFSCWLRRTLCHARSRKGVSFPIKLIVWIFPWVCVIK